MHLSPDQFQRIGHDHLQARARHWQARADQALAPPQRQDPLARLNVLAEAVTADQGVLAAHAGVDVRTCAQWLARALEQGTPWNETRAVALLHAAAALGAMWFVDGRLLQAEHQLPAQGSIDATAGALLGQPQGERYKRAVLREEQLLPALRAALHPALAAGPGRDDIERMARIAFDWQPPFDEFTLESDGQERTDDQPDPLAPQAEQFLVRERGLLGQAGVSDARLAAWCAAGDLLIGQGRCVRLLAASPLKADPDEAAAWLKEVLVDFAEFQS